MSNHLYQTLEFHKVLDDLAHRTHCPLAAKRLRHLRPLSTPELIRTSLARISEICTLMDWGVYLPIGMFDDVGHHLRSVTTEGSHLDPKAFRQIHRVLELVTNVCSFLKENRSNLSLLIEATRGLTPSPVLMKAIEKVVDLHSLEIRDQASPTLAAIRREMTRTRKRIQRQLEGLLDTLERKGVLQERLITIRSERWVLPVKETHRHLVDGILHDKSASGATVFVEPMETLELNNQIRRLEAEERHEIENVLRDLTDLVRRDLPQLEHNFEILVSVDCINASALASKAMNQHEPALDMEGCLEIKNGRHPLLVLKRGSLSDVVPLDFSIGQNFTTMVITGPNAGGKTVALKTLGLLALMVSCGLHIPADGDSKVPIFSRIFAHVGDAQSIEMDLSTFSAHLNGIKAIVEEASAGDLALIDEIGTGTDPQEGAALAMAVLETLTTRGTVTVVTTHHGSLKAFAHRTPGIANGSMAFDSLTLTPTYTFRADLPGSSYALEIAKRMGLPEDIVSRSRSFMGTHANQLGELILELEKQIARNTQLERDLQEERSIVDSLRKQFEVENARLKDEAKQLHQKATKEADTIIRRANATIEKAIRTIREKDASKEAIRQAKALVQEEKEVLRTELESVAVDKKSNGEDKLLGKVQPGESVYWNRSGLTGTVLSNKDASGRILVDFDKLKAHVPTQELSRGKAIARPSKDEVSKVEYRTPQNLRPETDIRGMRVADALATVDKFLDDALLAGLKEVRIIHGVGTGALRDSLASFLDQHPLVLSTSYGGIRHENPGVTIVKIADS